MILQYINIMLSFIKRYYQKMYLFFIFLYESKYLDGKLYENHIFRNVQNV